jgi:site-specific recombinase XerC
LLNEYCRYRRAHNGVAESTLHRDIETAQGFLAQLPHRRKPLKLATLADVDAFVQKVAARVSKGTVADTGSSLRAFLGFLHVTGRLAADLARSVMAPRFGLSERPPRTLPWGDVKLILRSIRRTEPPGKRDFAILLLLATYGLGAAEVLGSWASTRGFGLAGRHIESSQAKDQGAHRSPIVAGDRTSPDLVLAMGTSACQVDTLLVLA